MSQAQKKKRDAERRAEEKKGLKEGAAKKQLQNIEGGRILHRQAGHLEMEQNIGITPFQLHPSHKGIRCRGYVACLKCCNMASASVKGN